MPFPAIPFPVALLTDDALGRPLPTENCVLRDEGRWCGSGLYCDLAGCGRNCCC